MIFYTSLMIVGNVPGFGFTFFLWMRKRPPLPREARERAYKPSQIRGFSLEKVKKPPSNPKIDLMIRQNK